MLLRRQRSSIRIAFYFLLASLTAFTLFKLGPAEAMVKLVSAQPKAILEAYTSSTETGWPTQSLTDGNVESTWSSVGHFDHLNSAEWAAVFLSSRTRVDRVRFYPRKNPVDVGNSLGFPKDFVIQYSYQGDNYTCDPNSPSFDFAGNWRPLITTFGYPQPTDQPIDFTFSAVQAQCLRILGTELSQDDFGNRFMQLSEFQLLSDNGILPLSGALTSSVEPGWPMHALIDGILDSTWSSIGHFEHLASAEWAAVLLPGRTRVDRVRLYPRKNPVDVGNSLGFPKDFVIQYAYNGDGYTCDPNAAAFGFAGNWRPLITTFGYPQPSDQAITFSFGAVQAQCVRILGAELSQDDFGNRFMQFNEFQLLAGDSVLGVTGISTSSNESGWPAQTLIDGNLGNSWSSVGHFDHLASSEWAAVVLPIRTTLSRIRLYPRKNPVDLGKSLGFPKDFVIQYAYDWDGYTCDPSNANFDFAGNWRPLITRFGYPQPPDQPIDFTFASVQAGCLRIFGTELSQDDFGNRFMQLSEFQLPGVNFPTPTPVHYPPPGTATPTATATTTSTAVAYPPPGTVTATATATPDSYPPPAAPVVITTPTPRSEK